jgi:hypothetical protein
LRLEWLSFEHLPEQLRSSVEQRCAELGIRCRQMRSMTVKRTGLDHELLYELRCTCKSGARSIRVRRGTLSGSLHAFDRVQIESCCREAPETPVGGPDRACRTAGA